jgi:hypothetical protein
LLAGADHLGLVDLLANFHDYPIFLALAAIGFLGALEMLVSYVFRVIGEIVDRYYELRAKCASAKERYIAGSKVRASDTG